MALQSTLQLLLSKVTVVKVPLNKVHDWTNVHYYWLILLQRPLRSSRKFDCTAIPCASGEDIITFSKRGILSTLQSFLNNACYFPVDVVLAEAVE